MKKTIMFFIITSLLLAFISMFFFQSQVKSNINNITSFQSYLSIMQEKYLTNNLLMQGDIGKDVAILQWHLKELELLNNVDGIYGQNTKTAIKKLQKRHNMIIDGVFGDNTANVLLNCYDYNFTYSEKDVLFLSRIINGEARGEPFLGQIAVGAVVLNRVNSNKYPDNIIDVLRQPYQFCSVRDGQVMYNPNRNSIKAALIALMGYDPSHNALFFYNPDIATNTNWIHQKTITTQIGQHFFLKD